MICCIAASQYEPDLNGISGIDLDIVRHERTADAVIQRTWKSAPLLTFVDIGDITAHILWFTIRAKEHHPVRLFMVPHEDHSPACIIDSEIFFLLPHISCLFQFPFKICNRICDEFKCYFLMLSVVNPENPANSSFEFRDKSALIDGESFNLKRSFNISAKCKTLAEIRQPVDLRPIIFK